MSRFAASAQLIAGIARLEGRADASDLQETADLRPPSRMQWLRLGGLRRDPGRPLIEQLVAGQCSLLAGLAETGPFGMVLSGDAGGRLTVNVGVPVALGDNAASVLSAAMSNAQRCDPIPAASVWDRVGGLTHRATVAGNPVAADGCFDPAADRSAGPLAGLRDDPLEPLLDAMVGAGAWAYVVLALPVPARALKHQIQQLARERQELISAWLRPGTAEADNHAVAIRYRDLLDAAQRQRETARCQGLWDTRCWLLSERAQAAARGANAIGGAFCGQGLPRPLRVAIAPAAAPVTPLTSAELALLIHPPARERVGVPVTSRTRFAVDAPIVAGPAVALGTVDDPAAGAAAGAGEPWLRLPLADLCKHVMLSGVTGAGKTQTCQFVLRQLWEEHAVPWMVIEPSIKREYRALLHAPVGRDLSVYTVGDEAVNPLRLNPFQVPEGLHVQTHIDALGAVFTAAMAMVTPMPDVLRQAIEHVYAVRGWDLVSGRPPATGGPSVWTPTLGDLLEATRNLIRRLGYSGEIRSNLEAGLVLRLQGLRVGARGRLLDCERSTPIERLLDRPVVLELASLGSDADKALVIGLLMLRLVEHRQVQGSGSGRLRHLLVIEEAHRLLSGPKAGGDIEAAEAKGQAVQALCHLLAEVRAMGQGIAAVDQSPSALAPEMIKNTATKITHRVVAIEDRDALGGCMNLDDAQRRHLATLCAGRAVVYGEGRAEALAIRVPNHARHLVAAPVTDDLLRSNALAADGSPAGAGGPGGSGGVSAERIASQEGCGSCDAGRCAQRGAILCALLDRRHGRWSRRLEAALDSGWTAAWALGERLLDAADVAERSPGAVACALGELASALCWSGAQRERFDHNVRRLRRQKESADA